MRCLLCVRGKRYQFAGEQRYGTIPRTSHAVAVSERGPSGAGQIGAARLLLDMTAALWGQAEDIAANRSLTPEQRFPVVGKIGVLHADCDGAPLDGGEPRPAPQQREPIGQGEGARKQPIARRFGCRVETGCRVPEQALKDEATAKISYRRGDNAAGTDDAPHFAHRLRRVTDEIERELRQRRGETALDVGEAAGIRDGEIYAGGALP
jgi:hypothetical protein